MTKKRSVFSTNKHFPHVVYFPFYIVTPRTFFNNVMACWNLEKKKRERERQSKGFNGTAQSISFSPSSVVESNETLNSSCLRCKYCSTCLSSTWKWFDTKTFIVLNLIENGRNEWHTDCVLCLIQNKALWIIFLRGFVFALCLLLLLCVNYPNQGEKE